MRNFILLALFFLLFLFGASCKKDPSPSNPGLNSFLTDFTVTVDKRTPETAIIHWTKSSDIINDSVVKYKIYLNDALIHKDIIALKDTLVGLSGDTAYNGKVVAYSASGDSVTAEFYLEKLNGYVLMGLQGEFLVLNFFTGSPLYHIPMREANYWEWSGVTVSHDTAFFANSNLTQNAFFAYNYKTSKQLWAAASYVNGGDIPRSTPTYYQGKLFVVNNAGISVYNAATGQVLWKKANISQGFSGNIEIYNNRMYVSGLPAYRHLYALNLTDGSLIWDFNYVGQMGEKLITDNKIIFGTSSSLIYAVDATTGVELWKRDLHTSSNDFGCDYVKPIVVGNKVIINHPNEGFYALNIKTGSTVWISNAGADPSVSGVTQGDGRLYFTMKYSSTIIRAIDPNNGVLIWQKNSNEPSLSTPLYVKGKLYLQSQNGIEVRDAANGNQEQNLWYKPGNGTGPATIVINDTSYTYH